MSLPRLRASPALVIAIVTLVAAVSGVPCAHAISEIGYSARFRAEVRPFAEQRLAQHRFASADGTSLAYVTYRGRPNGRGTILFSPGRTESATVFHELLFDLAARGYSLAVIDHRGQGLSARAFPESDMGHVDRFADYTSDFTEFLRQPAVRALPQPWHLLANSMGAAIALPTLIPENSPFRDAAIVAPMLQIQTSPFPDWLALGLAQGLSFLGHAQSYAPTRGPFDLHQPFAGNLFTSSRIRFETDLETLREHPRVVVGGPSVAWVRETLSMSRTLAQQPPRISRPVVLLSAGQDRIVSIEAQRKLCAILPHCRQVNYPTARHLLLMESDPIRDDLLRQIDTQFQP